LFLDLTPNHRLTPIELIHCKLFNPRRTVFNCITLLIADHVRIDSQRYPWVTVPQLLLHDSRGCTVCKQSTGHTVTCGAESAAWYAQLHKQPVQNLCPELAG
jgi:hypothetical protein